MNVANWDTKPYPSNITVIENEFHQKILSSCHLVQIYEDPLLQQKARAVIPVDLLQARARERLDTSNRGGAIVGLMDCLLVELLGWFKKDFFRWFNTPICTNCSRPTTNMGSAEPSLEELRWGGNRVEEYNCVGGNCETTAFRFPRYNHPEKLLQTRIGRCGEWANCFTLCCVSLGMEARYVLDWTDHVWTEVHSASQGRWLHCDPCENLCDSPLVYESGWNKKLNYVLAFSKDDIQDVTWRYSSRHAKVLSRRLLCRETWLLQAICSTRSRLQAHVRPSRKAELDRRLVVELGEFLCARRAVKHDEVEGRTSGSLDWRRARGETKDKSDTGSSNVFQLTKDEVMAKKFRVRYCTATDVYERIIDNSDDASTATKVRGWQKGVHSASNVFRKVEPDWKQAYLARTEGSDVGRVSWKVDVGDADLTVKRVGVRCDSSVYENGLVNWKIYARDKCVLVTNYDSRSEFLTTALSGEREVTIEAELSGGRGSLSWQHAQLFRLSLNDTGTFPFDICITYV